MNYLADELNGILRNTLNKIITDSLASGQTFRQMADRIQQALDVGSTMPGWRELRIAKTESMWAVNEGTRQQYVAVGVRYVTVVPALTACNLCMNVARQSLQHRRCSGDFARTPQLPLR